MRSIQDALRGLCGVVKASDSLGRKIFMITTVTAIGAGVGVFGFRAYRTYILNKNINDSNKLFQEIDFEANLTKSMLKADEIEEVFDDFSFSSVSLYFCEFNFFFKQD